MDGSGFSEVLQVFAKALPSLLKGARITVELTAVSILAGIIIGFTVALMRLSKNRVLSGIAYFYALVIRGTPLLVQIYIVYFQINFKDPFVAGVVALGINYGAYMSEIIRAAIESIDKGQMEAARSLGMSHGLAMRRIIIPQTYKRLIPPINNEFIAMLKDTSLVSIMSTRELTRAGVVFINQSFKTEVYYEIALIYLALTTVFSIIGTYLEKTAGVHE